MPTRGMERWLTQRLSDRLGRLRQRRVPVPARAGRRRGRGRVGRRARRRPVAARARGLAAARGRRGAPRRAVAARRCARYLGGRTTTSAARGASAPSATSPTFRPLRAAPARRWCAAWAARGRTTHWQAELWRRLRARIGDAEPGRAARRRVRAAARGAGAASTCPPRLSLFGLTRLPAGHLRGAARRSPRGRDVHLFLLHPSPALWDAARGAAAAGRRRARATRRADARREPRCSPRGAATRASCSSSSRARRARRPPPRRSTHPAGTLLAALQADVRADRAPGAATPLPPTTAASRSTPATAAPARSRCCATRSCTCSPTTRRSSRAT